MPIGYPDPPLGDDLVSLRPWRKSDIATVIEASRDPYIPKVTSVPAPFTKGAGERWLERQDVRSRSGLGVSLAIVEIAEADVARGQTLHKASTADLARGQTPHKGGADEAVGAVVLMHRGQGVYGLGYWLLPAARGRGLASRAVGLVVEWALVQPEVAELEALVEPWNEESVRVVQRAGFSRDRLLSAEISVAGREADVVRYVLSGQSPRSG